MRAMRIERGPRAGELAARANPTRANPTRANLARANPMRAEPKQAAAGPRFVFRRQASREERGPVTPRWAYEAAAVDRAATAGTLAAPA